MDNKIPATFGARLRKAREDYGLTQEDLAKAVGLSSRFISNLEIGKRLPSFESLHTLSKYLKKDVSYFLSKKEKAFDLLLKDRGLKKNTKTELNSFKKYCDDYLHLEEITGRRLEPAPVYSNISPIRMALEERRRLGLGTEPIKDIFSLIEVNGLRTFLYPFKNDGHLSGIFIYFDVKEAAFALLNNRLPAGNQTLAAAHLFCHYLKDRFTGPIVDNLDIFIDEHLPLYHPREKFAQSFAVQFLVPASKVKEIVEKDIRSNTVTYEDVIYLKRYFGINTLTMLNRLKDLNYLPYKTYREYKNLDSDAYENTLFDKSEREKPSEMLQKTPVSSERFKTLAVIASERNNSVMESLQIDADINSAPSKDFNGIK
jgi:transcriptional regulator with XRE-family HTH domain